MKINLIMWIIILIVNLIGTIGNYLSKQKKIALLNLIGTTISIFVIILEYIL